MLNEDYKKCKFLYSRGDDFRAYGYARACEFNGYYHCFSDLCPFLVIHREINKIGAKLCTVVPNTDTIERYDQSAIEQYDKE